MSNSQKISQFTTKDTFADSDLLTFLNSGQNFTMSFGNFKLNLGVTGTLTDLSAGTSGTAILQEPTAQDYQIRGIEVGDGLTVGTSPEDNVLVDLDFVNGSGGIPIIKDLNSSQYEFRSIIAGDGIAVAATNGGIRISASESTGQNIVSVTSLADLPAPVGGDIQLEDATIYIFTAETVDISPNRLLCGEDTSIKGSSSYSTSLVSSASGSLIKGEGSFEVGSITIECPNAIAIEHDSPIANFGAVVVRGIYVRDCTEIIKSNNHNILLIENAATLTNSVTGITVLGENGFTLLDTSLFQNVTGTFLDLADSTHINVAVENITISTSSSATVPVDGLPNSGNVLPGGIGDVRALNIFGDFTPSGNITSSDIRWRVRDSNQIQDTTNSSYISMPVNATNTVISAVNTPVKVSGTWTDVESSRFTNTTDGRITYIGEKDISVNVTVTCSCEKIGSGVNTYILSLAVKGSVNTNIIASFSTDTTRDMQISLTGNLTITNGDYLELFIENSTSTDDVRVYAANFIVKE